MENKNELNRFKLLLNYNVEKTLKENVEDIKDIVTEQTDEAQFDFLDDAIVETLANSKDPHPDKYRDKYVQEYIKEGLTESEATARYNRIAGEWWEEYGNQESDQPNREQSTPNTPESPIESPTESESNVLTDDDMMGNTNKLRSYFQHMSDFGNIFGLPNLFDVLGLNLANIIDGRRDGVKGVVDALDGWVSKEDITYVLTTIKTLEGKCYIDDAQIPPVKVPAMVRFLELYTEDEDGENLIDEINNVGTKTLPAGTEKLKQKIVNLINNYVNTPCEGVEDSSENERIKNIGSIYCSVDENGIIRNENSDHNGKTWDSYVEIYNITPEEIEEAKKQCPDDETSKKQGPDKEETSKKQYYYPCKDFPFELYCMNGAIKQIQECLGLKSDSMFGPKTMTAIKGKLPNFDGKITKEIYNTLMSGCQEKTTPPKEYKTMPKPEIKRSKLNLSGLQQDKPITIQGRGKTPEQMYRELEPQLKTGKKRIKLKGNITPETYQKLTQYLSKLGYVRKKIDPTKDYGVKYVWGKK